MHLCGELHLPEILFGWTSYYFFEALFLFLCLCCIHERLWWLFIHRKVLQWSCFCAPFASVWTALLSSVILWALVLLLLIWSKKMFLFLDSYFSKDDDYSVLTRRKLIPRFCHAWDMFVGSNVDFQHFKIAYPRVPKQSNTVDCGVFVIKFMEIWHFGADLRKDFSAEDIPNIRIQIVNDLLMSEHNKADRGVVTNFHGQVWLSTHQEVAHKAVG